jgi:hypothetical protein
MKGLVAAAALAAVLVPVSPAFAGDEVAARAAAKRGAEWLAGLQRPDGSGLGGFGLTALAAGGLHPADVRVGDGPSAQTRAQADWAASGAGPRGTDLARSLLAAHAAGIDPTLISAERNFVAETLALFDGQRLYDPGAASSLSDDIFGTLGLGAVGAPQPLLDALAAFLRSQQTATGGWNFTEGAANASVDMTGAGVGALCAAGAPVSDPAVAKALAFLRERQDPVTAGWGANSDTAGWVVSGLRTCGVDPKQWVRNGRDPLDDLMSRQLPSGGFKWRDTDTTENALATLDSVRPLGGAGFTADPPERSAGQRFLDPPVVPDGTEVPVGVVVDYGVAVRACSVRVRTGAPIETVGATAPCVSEWGSGTWSIAHRDDSSVVRPGDVVTLRRATPVAAPTERVVERIVQTPTARITGVTRRRGRLVITTSGAERIGVARVSGRRCRPVRASGRLGRRVACGDALSMLPGPRLELRAGPGRYLIRADAARLVVTVR